MKVLLVLAALVFVLVFSVKFAARQVDAKSGTGIVLLCLLVQGALSGFLSRIGIGPSWLLQFVVAFAAGALVYSVLLDTTFKKGVVISLLSSGIMVLGFVVIIGLAGLRPDPVVQQPSLAEMEQLSVASLARDRGYNEIASRALIGDGSEIRRCMSKQSRTPDDFVVYLEILPDGSSGKLRFEPQTEVAECFRKTAAKRHFPTPPGAYVTKSIMAFKRG